MNNRDIIKVFDALWFYSKHIVSIVGEKKYKKMKTLFSNLKTSVSFFPQNAV